MQYPAFQESSIIGDIFPFRAAVAVITCVVTIVAAALLFPSSSLPAFVLPSGAILVLCALAWLQIRSIGLSRQLWCTRQSSLDDNPEFRSAFEEAFDALLIFDDQLTCRAANPAAAQMFGLDRHRLIGRSMNQLTAEPATMSRLCNKLRNGTSLRGRLELTRADGRRVPTEFSCRRGRRDGQLLLKLHDETALTRAREVNRRTLAVARAGIAKAELLHRATVAVSRAEPLNAMLDSLLEILHTAVPFEISQVFIFEDPTRLFLARQSCYGWSAAPPIHGSETFDLCTVPLLERLLEERSGILLRDDGVTGDQRGCLRGPASGSWLGVPLYAGETAMGFLTLAHSDAGHLDTGDLRLAGALAGPFALAVYNARLFERAEIFRTGLAQRLSDLPTL
jgi:PAS domain S-box-containing protein